MANDSKCNECDNLFKEGDIVRKVIRGIWRKNQLYWGPGNNASIDFYCDDCWQREGAGNNV